MKEILSFIFLIKENSYDNSRGVLMVGWVRSIWDYMEREKVKKECYETAKELIVEYDHEHTVESLAYHLFTLRHKM